MCALSVPAIALTRGTNGEEVLIPQLGLGTYKVSDDEAERVVCDALEVGYRHIDTAQMYGNEAGVGRAIKASGLARQDLFITSKLNNPNHRREDALRSMIEILHSGRVRAIGVSNYQPEHLNRIVEATGVVPAVNQVELHPWLTQSELRSVHEQLGVVTESWSPLGRGRLLTDPKVIEIADAIGVSPAQVVIRWHLQNSLVVIPKSTHRERMTANADVIGFTLDDAHMAALDALDQGVRTGSHPDRIQV